MTPKTADRIEVVQAAKRFVRLSQNDLCDFHVY